MLMSIIRFCGQNDTRMAKQILAEISNASLFLYCKESHQLVGQYGVEEFKWYIGLESGALVHSQSIGMAASDDGPATSQTPDFASNSQ